MSKKKTKKPNWKKRILTLSFIALNIIVIAWTAFYEFTDTENAAKLNSVEIRWYLLIPACLLFIIAMSADVYKYFLMLRETCKISDWKIAFYTVFLGRYYDNITPAAIGGQPFQIHYMITSNVPKGYSAMIPLLGMISGQIAFMIVAILAFLFGAPLIHNGAILASGCLGLLFYAFFPVVVLGATFFPSLTNEIILGLAKILAHLRIIKDPHSFTNKIQSSTKQYTDCVKVIIKKRHLSLKVMTLSFLYVFCTYSIPFFVLLTFGGEINFIACFITTLAIASTIYFIPTPGNTGAAEGSFFVVFSSLTSGFIFWAMLFWRFFTFYSYILIGLVLHATMYVDKRKKPLDA